MRIVNKLDLDNPTITSEHGSWSMAKNIQISENVSHTENEDILKTIQQLPNNTNCIGYITTPSDIVLFYGYSDKLEISLLRNDLLEDRVVILDNRYFNQKITGTYTYNYKGELIITFGVRDHDGPEILVVNLDTLGGKTINLNSSDYKKIQLFPDYFKQQPRIDLNNINKGGNLDTGVYFLSLCYEDDFGNRSDFTPLSNRILIVPTDDILTKTQYTINIIGNDTTTRLRRRRIRIYNGEGEYQDVIITEPGLTDFQLITNINNSNSGRGIVFSNGLEVKFKIPVPGTTQLYAYNSSTDPYEFKVVSRSFEVTTQYELPINSSDLKASGFPSFKSISVKLSNLDTTWKFIRLGILYYKDNTLAQSKLSDKYICKNSFDIDVTTINEYPNIALESLLIQSTKYLHSKSITSNKEKLLLSNVALTDTKFEVFQDIANEVVISYSSNKRINLSRSYTNKSNFVNTYTNGYDAYYNVGYKYGETYAFYIAFESIKGGYLSVNPIPYNPSNLEEYKTNQQYPDNFGRVSNQSISFHKFPEIHELNSNFDPDNLDFRILGIDINNVNIPDNLKSICSGWRIFYAERTSANITRLGTIYRLYYKHREVVSNANNIFHDYDHFYSFNLQYDKIPLNFIKRLESRYKYITLNPKPIGTNSGDVHQTDGIINGLSTKFIVDTTNVVVDKLKYESGIDNFLPDRITLVNQDWRNLPEEGVMIYEIITTNDGKDIYQNILNQTLVSTGIYNSSDVTSIKNVYGGDSYFGRNSIPLYHSDPSIGNEIQNAKIFIHFLESPYNIETRYEGVEDYQKLYWHSIASHRSHDELVKIRTLPRDKGSYINDEFGKSYDLTYGKINNIESPIVDNEDYENIFKNRIAISDPNSTESLRLGWKVFRPNSYHDVGFNRGEIYKLTSADQRLFIQARYGLFVAQIKDVLQLADGSQAWLGTGDLFDRPPQELIYDESGGIGCRDYEAAKYTPLGYIVFDRDRKAIYLIGEENKDLSLNNFKQWLTNNTNATNNDNYIIGYDHQRSRFIFHGDNEFTVSYNIRVDGLVSFHDYKFKYLVNNRSGVYTLDNTTINKFFNTPTNNPSYIDINFTAEANIQKLFQSIIWQTEYLLNGQKDYSKTIDNIMVYNDSQCTGLLPVKLPDQWFDNKTGVYISDQWYFNQLHDAVINDKQPFLIDNMPNNNVRINRKDWFDISQIISKFITIRLQSNNEYKQRIRFINLMVEAIKDNR